MKSYIFIFLATSWTIVSSEEINGLDSNVFEQVKNVDNAKGSKQQAFVSIIWPELTKFLPDSARVPGVELPFQLSTESEIKEKDIISPSGILETDQWYHNYICATETRIHLKLEEMESTNEITKKDGKVIVKENGKMVVGVMAKFSMNGETMDYDLYKKIGGTYVAVGPVSVRNKFPHKSKISLVFDIPDVSKGSAISDTKCLVNLRSLEITELSKPEFANNLDKRSTEIAEYYWQVFANEVKDMNVVMSVGVRRAIHMKLQRLGGNHWICISDDLKKQLIDDEDAYIYKTAYQNYCKDFKLDD